MNQLHYLLKTFCHLIAISAITFFALSQGDSCIFASDRNADDVWENFEGPKTSWTPVAADTTHRFLTHRRTRSEAYRGYQSEWFQLDASAGTFVHIGHSIGKASVIDELALSAWVKTDRPGIQMLARVVLPGSVDPRTGRPRTTLIRGDLHSKTGQWQQLTIKDIPHRVKKAVQSMRMQFGPQVTARGAWVDQILVNTFGGQGITNVWIDDLDVEGYLELQIQRGDKKNAGAPVSGDRVLPAAYDQSVTGNSQQKPLVRMDGTVCVVNDRPFFPRIIEYQGESFDLLKRLGFNAVKLSTPATDEQLQEAKRLDLMLVCPPPGVESGQTIPDAFRQVMAWDLGSGLSKPELAATRDLSANIRRADAGASRPLICTPTTELRAYSRCANLLLLERLPFGTGFELADFGPWLRQRPKAARPGTPCWAVIQTEPSQESLTQMTGLSGGIKPIVTLEYEQILMASFCAVAAGSRGLCFQSDTPLDTKDERTRLRAASLELTNMYLQLVQPWGAGGRRVTEIETPTDYTRAVMLETKRAKLLLVMHIAPGAQYTSTPPAEQSLTLVVPGIPESSSSYQLVPTGLEMLRSRRVTGGTRVTLTPFSGTAAILLTQNPLAVNALNQVTQKNHARAARLQHDIANRTMTLITNIQRYLRVPNGQSTAMATAMDRAKSELQQSSLYLLRNDSPRAFRAASQAATRLAAIRRNLWSETVGGFASPVSGPHCTFFATLPLHQQLGARLRSSRLGLNMLPAGDFVDLQQVRDARWNLFPHPGSGLATDVTLDKDQTASGGSALRMVVSRDNPEQRLSEIESPPLWIQSPSMKLAPGTIVRINGRVSVPTAITGATDGVMVVDSWGGEPLAFRTNQTRQWRNFALYRVAPADGRPLILTLVLSGIGEARFDKITVTPFETGQPTAVGSRDVRGVRGR